MIKQFFQPIWFPLALAIWLSLVLTVLIHNWGWWRDGDWFETIMPLVLGTLTSVLVGGGLLACAVGLSSLIGHSTDSVWHQCWHAKLASLRNADGVSGSISGGLFVVVGHVNSQEIYYYYTDEGREGYKPHKWSVNSDTTVFEEDRADAEVFQFDTAFANPTMNWFALPNERLRMDFHVPRGSLIQRYELK